MLRKLLFISVFLFFGMIGNTNAQGGIENEIVPPTEPVFAPEDNTIESTLEDMVEPVASDDEAINDGELAEALSSLAEMNGGEDVDFTDDDVLKALDEVQQDIAEENVVTMRLEKPIEKADVKIGQTLEVSLLEEEPKEWSFDKTFKTLKLVGTNKIASRVIITFEVVEMGGERLYFDYIDKSNGGFKVIESRILDINAGM